MTNFFLDKKGTILRGDNEKGDNGFKNWNIYAEKDLTGGTGGYYIYITHATKFNEWGFAFDEWVETYEDLVKWFEEADYEIDWETNDMKFKKIN